MKPPMVVPSGRLSAHYMIMESGRLRDLRCLTLGDKRDLDAAKALCAQHAGVTDPQWRVHPPGLDMPVPGQAIVWSLIGTAHQVHWHVS